jgi:phage-related protein
MSVCPSVRHNIQKKTPKKPKNGIEIPKKKMKQKMKFQKTLLGSPLVF